MFCKKCGKQLQEDAKFCLNCGEKIISSPLVINESFKQKLEKESKNDTQKNSGARLGVVIGILAVLVIVVVFVFFGKGNNSVVTNKTETAGNSSFSDAGFGSNTEAAIEQKTSEELFAAYLENTLIPELGMADLSERSASFSFSDPEAQTKTIEWERLQGILGYKIADIDGDNEEELLVIHTTHSDNLMSVYEISNGDILLAQEILIVAADRSESYDENFSVIYTDKGTFVLYAYNTRGVYGDGYFAEMSLWRYEGTNITPAMLITRTEGGSEFFVFTSYKYNSNGEQVSEEIIYDASDYDNEQYNIYDEDGSILASQFAEYGIEINGNINMVSEIGAFENLIADNTNHEVLCNLDVWADGFCLMENGVVIYDTYTFYFNDSNKDRNMILTEYRKLLNQKQKELLEIQAQEKSKHGFASTHYQYLFHDFNEDGIEELLLYKQLSGYLWCNIYSYVDGQIKEIFSLEKVDAYTSTLEALAENGFIVHEASVDPEEYFYTTLYQMFNGDFLETTYFIYRGYDDYYAVGAVSSGPYNEFSSYDEYEKNYQIFQRDLNVQYLTNDMWFNLEETIQLPSADFNNKTNTENTAISSNPEYILPTSNSAFLTNADLTGLTAEECRIARNELYARHGRMFTDETLQAYFESCSWYQGTIPAEEFDDSVLNEYEIANRDLLVQYEEEQGYRFNMNN